MNPIEAKTPTDRAKYREIYLANLAIEHSNNTLNLNANEQYKALGQTPVQPTDTRTITQKFADLERLKIELRSALSAITDGSNANKIVMGLTPDEIRFASSQMPYIIQDLKPKWSNGIPAPAFIAYLRRLMEKYVQTQGVEYGLQQATGRDILLSQQQILGAMPNEETFRAIQMTLTSIRQSNSVAIRNLIESIKSEMAQMREAIPTAQDFSGLERLPPSVRADIQQLLNQALADVPTRGQVQEDLRSIEQAIQNNDQRALERSLRGLRGDLEMDEATRIQMEQIKQEILDAIRNAVSQNAPTAEAVATEAGSPTRGEPVMTDQVKTIADFDDMNLTRKKLFLQQTGLSSSLKDADGKKVALTKVAASRGGRGIYWEDTNMRSVVESWLAAGGSAGPKQEGKGLKMKGKGLKMTAPIEKPRAYVPFGSVALNKHKLQDGILMLRNPSGGVLADLPTHKIGDKLTKIVKTMVGGSIPSFEEINELEDHEKDHLHKILRRTKQLDKVSVPKPKQHSKNETEMIRFEILRGQIMAGNDNRHLVKEFKVLLIKLMNRGVVPKRQAHDILVDITSMGL